MFTHQTDLQKTKANVQNQGKKPRHNQQEIKKTKAPKTKAHHQLKMPWFSVPWFFDAKPRQLNEKKTKAG